MPIIDNIIYTSINHPVGMQAFGTSICKKCGKEFTLIGDNINDIASLQEKGKLNINDYLTKEKNSEISEFKRKL